MEVAESVTEAGPQAGHPKAVGAAAELMIARTATAEEGQAVPATA